VVDGRLVLVERLVREADAVQRVGHAAATAPTSGAAPGPACPTPVTSMREARRSRARRAATAESGPPLVAFVAL
jgi:hypothetical protein